MISFNKPYITGNEFLYIQEAIKREKLSGNGYFTKKCHEYFENRYGFKKVLLTHSCTAALEMAAILLEIGPGDEIIMPSYTFVSTANAFLLRGGKIVFTDSNSLNPNLDVDHVKQLITDKTKAIVVVHYAGVACDMDSIMEMARERAIFVIEDAAQAIDSFYKGRPLGSIGHLAAFSFHETKNIISGEGGMLVINDSQFIERSEIIWEKGTNRAAFARQEVSKYNWVDIGSSFLPSEITSAFLLAQLESLDKIQTRRKKLWQFYYDSLKALAEGEILSMPLIDKFASNNAHIFYIVTKTEKERSELITFMKKCEVQCIFHYLPLHNSPFFGKHSAAVPVLPNAEYYGNCLVRLPLYFELTEEQINIVVHHLYDYYKGLHLN